MDMRDIKVAVWMGLRSMSRYVIFVSPVLKSLGILRAYPAGRSAASIVWKITRHMELPVFRVTGIWKQ
jgi:hypothetical protein